MQKGYLCVYNGHGRVRQGGAIHYPLHRLLYEQAHGVLPKSVIVHHVNEDKLDNRIENLEAVSRSEHPSRHASSTINGQRRCTRCESWKPVSEFSVQQYRCKPCKLEAERERLTDQRRDDLNRRRRLLYAGRAT